MCIFYVQIHCDYRPGSSAGRQHAAERVQHRPHQPGRALVSTQHRCSSSSLKAYLHHLCRYLPYQHFYAAFLSQRSATAAAQHQCSRRGWMCADQCCVAHCHPGCRQSRDTQSLCTSTEAPNPFSIPADEDLFRLQVCTSRRSSHCRHQSSGPAASECKAWTQPCSNRAGTTPEFNHSWSWHMLPAPLRVFAYLRLP